MANLTVDAAVAYVTSLEQTWEDYEHLRVAGAALRDEEGIPVIAVKTEGWWSDTGLGTSTWDVWVQDGQIYGEC